MNQDTIDTAEDFSALWCDVKSNLFRLINSYSENTDLLGSLSVGDFFLFENLCKDFVFWG